MSKTENNAASVPIFPRLTSSPSASDVEISKTFVCPFVTSTLVARLTNTGALSFKLLTEINIFGEVAVNEPSLAITANEYILSSSESVGFSKSGELAKETPPSLLIFNKDASSPVKVYESMSPSSSDAVIEPKDIVIFSSTLISLAIAPNSGDSLTSEILTVKVEAAL